LLRLAGIQFTCSEDKQRNIEKALAFCDVAVEKGANILCFPELFTTHWFPKDMNPDVFSLAEESSGAAIQHFRDIASRHEVVVICPIFEKDSEGSYYNSAIVIDAGGAVLGAYRKVHVPQIPLWEEKYYFAAGNRGFPVFDTRFGKIGILICWDNFFPEAARILALKGAQIIFSPTAAAFASKRRWETMIASHAISNGVFFFRINRVGSEEKQDFYGSSFCVSPDGEFMDKPTGMKESIALVDIDLNTIERVRKEWTFLKDRRPEFYPELLHGGAEAEAGAADE
jgi:N-carbamoylputrescine amidase